MNFLYSLVNEYNVMKRRRFFPPFFQTILFVISFHYFFPEKSNPPNRSYLMLAFKACLPKNSQMNRKTMDKKKCSKVHTLFSLFLCRYVHKCRPLLEFIFLLRMLFYQSYVCMCVSFLSAKRAKSL